jgi:hypothetical protein
MKYCTLLAALTISAPALAQGDNLHDGYTRRDGSYVQRSCQAIPNSSRFDDWSTQ